MIAAKRGGAFRRRMAGGQRRGEKSAGSKTKYEGALAGEEARAARARALLSHLILQRATTCNAKASGAHVRTRARAITMSGPGQDEEDLEREERVEKTIIHSFVASHTSPPIRSPSRRQSTQTNTRTKQKATLFAVKQQTFISQLDS